MPDNHWVPGIQCICVMLEKKRSGRRRVSDAEKIQHFAIIPKYDNDIGLIVNSPETNRKLSEVSYLTY